MSDVSPETAHTPREPQWPWLRARRGDAICPRCFAFVLGAKMGAGAKQFGEAALRLMDEPGVKADADEAIENIERARARNAAEREKDYPPVSGARRGRRVIRPEGER